MAPPATIPAGRRRFDRSSPWVVAALFVLPYFLLMMSWAWSNPPGAAPDERDHLVKALGMARLDIGTTYTGPVLGSQNLGMQRNASIARVIPVPSNLMPTGYNCEAARPATSAACLPTVHTSSTAPSGYVDSLGSYPPFLYVPMGLVASLANDPSDAFLLTRLFCALGCGVLLLLGAAHLVRWLGRRALLGAFVGLTPMVVFCTSIVSTSGFEICAGFAVACIVVVVTRRPESLLESGTQLLLAGVGGTLILSRQLGVVTCGLLIVVLLVRGGWRFVWQLARHPRLPFLATIGILGLSTAALTWWERGYDHPSLTGPVLSSSALGAFSSRAYNVVVLAVAKFGWADTLVPAWFVGTWIVLCVVLVGIAVLVAKSADRWTLVVWFVALVIVCYVTYATVFYPVDSSVQGRHMLAFFMLLPMLAGTVVVERLDRSDPATVRRMFLVVAVVMPALQAACLYVNARRYAVGSHGPIWFLGSSKWRPPGGWELWLATALIGSALLAWTIAWIGRPPSDARQVILEPDLVAADG